MRGSDSTSTVAAMPTYLTLPEYAKHTGMAKSTVYKLVADGKLKTVKRKKIIPRFVTVPCVLIKDIEPMGVK